MARLELVFGVAMMSMRVVQWRHGRCGAVEAW